MNALPTLRHPSRRRPLLWLLAAGIARGVLAFLTVALFARIGSHPDSLAITAAALIAAALGLGLLRALETVQAERLGQAYVHSLRKRLIRNLDEGGVQGMGRFGRGSLWLRLTSDLNGLRRWISQGLARSVAAMAMMLSLSLALLFHTPMLAAFAVGMAALALLGMWAVRGALQQTERSLRRHRARLANEVERRLDHVARPRARDEVAINLKSLPTRSRRVADASVARAAVHAQVRALTEFVPLASVALAIGLSGAMPGAQVLPMLALVGLMAQPLRDLGLAWEMRQSYRIAVQKIQPLLERPPLSRAAGSSPAPAEHNGPRSALFPATSRETLKS